MRSYVHHLGDWAAHTATLPWMECAAYHKLIETYYITEQPLPGNESALFRLIGAATFAERSAVRNVLTQFFTLETDGCYHQKRCDDELAKHGKFRQDQKEKIGKRWNLHNAGKAIRDAKTMIQNNPFEQSHIAGCFLSPGLTNPSRAVANPSEQPSDTVGITNGIPTVIPNLYPKPINYEQTPVNAKTAAAATAVCVEKGFRITAQDPRLLALVADGATAADFAAAATQAAGAGKSWAYCTGIVANQLSDKARMAQEGTKTAPGGPNYPMLPRFHDPR